MNDTLAVNLISDNSSSILNALIPIGLVIVGSAITLFGSWSNNRYQTKKEKRIWIRDKKAEIYSNVVHSIYRLESTVFSLIDATIISDARMEKLPFTKYIQLNTNMYNQIANCLYWVKKAEIYSPKVYRKQDIKNKIGFLESALKEMRSAHVMAEDKKLKTLNDFLETIKMMAQEDLSEKK